MEIAKLVLEYLKVIVWPGVILVALTIFRHELCALIATLEHLKLPGGAELEWKRQMLAAEQAAGKIEAAVSTTPSPTEQQQNCKNSATRNRHQILIGLTIEIWLTTIPT
jgi:hypothetical protein